MNLFGFILDLAQMLIGLYGGFLFSWWWYVLRKASGVYIIITIVFFGFSLHKASELYYRHMMAAHALVCDHSEARLFDSNWWLLRDMPLFAGLSALVVAMTFRAARTVAYYRELDKGGDAHEEKLRRTANPGFDNPNPQLRELAGDGANPGDPPGPDEGKH